MTILAGMFTPTTPATLVKMNGGFDAEGGRVPGDSISLKVGLVKLRDQIKKSPQDADGSASQNASDESQIVATVLIPPQFTPAKGDKLSVSGMALRIESIWPQYDTAGRHDHWECDASAWVWG